MSSEIINDMFELIDCPVCGENSHKPYFSIPYGDLAQKPSLDYSSLGIAQETVLYVKKCRQCEFVFANPRVKPKFESLVYNESKKNMYINKPYLKEPWTFENKMRMRVEKINHLRPLLICLNRKNGKKDLKFLDYGAGFGNAMSWAEHLGIESYGVDIDRERLGACEKMNLKVSTPEKFDTHYPNIKVDVILLQSCIEHIIDLQAAMTFIAEHSNPGALIWVNALTPRLIKVEKRKGIYDKSHFLEHVNYFTFNNLDLLFNKYGFEPVKNRFTYPIVRNFKDFRRLMVQLLAPASLRTFVNMEIARIYEFRA